MYVYICIHILFKKKLKKAKLLQGLIDYANTIQEVGTPTKNEQLSN